MSKASDQFERYLTEMFNDKHSTRKPTLAQMPAAEGTDRSTGVETGDVGT